MKNHFKNILHNNEPLWYRKAIIYQLHVRAFYDSNKDGIGDFAGLDEKLEYLKDLNINTVWLLPFYKSPLKDDGYDISDYYNINPIYGDLDEFKKFLDKAHQLGIRVITELVLNHTSDQHEWFQRARRAPEGSIERDFYVWSNDPSLYSDARIIFQDFESSNWTWDTIAKSYYWHRFYSHQPDLNFDNPAVHQALLDVVDFWFNLGVDGLRLDAIPYLYEREGTNCENLPETHQFLKKLRQHIDSKHKDKMILAEANQWTEETVKYFGDGDECHMCFHFPIMPRIFMAVEKEDRFPIVDILGQTPAIPANCQWAIFLRNHDELTLEMVTEEERDFMYRAFASEARAKINLGIRRRLAPLMGNNRRKIELLNGLLFSLPGTPIIYYGDEIGMGDNIYLGDRNGVRTPLQWSPERNAGFSRAPAQQLYLPINIDHEYHYEAVNIETQQQNSNSLLWWMKRLIKTRKDSLALSFGEIKMLHPNNRKILAFLREYKNEKVLFLANLSRYSQYTELSLPDYKGSQLIEMMGMGRFPKITEKPLPISMAPHQFYWFELRTPEEMHAGISAQEIDEITISTDEIIWEQADFKDQLEVLVTQYLKNAPWFLEETENIKSIDIEFLYPLFDNRTEFTLLGLNFTFIEEGDTTYVVPLTFAKGLKAIEIMQNDPQKVLAKIKNANNEDIGVIAEAQLDPEFYQLFLNYFCSSEENHSFLKWLPNKNPNQSLQIEEIIKRETTNHRIFSIQDKNTIHVYEGKMIIKCFHHLEVGTHPESEISQYLTNQNTPLSITPFIGEFKLNLFNKIYTWGIVNEYAPNKRSMHEYTKDELVLYLEKIQLKTHAAQIDDLNLDFTEIKKISEAQMETFLNTAKEIGERLKNLHLVLSKPNNNNDFNPEKINDLYVRSLGQTARELVIQTAQELSDCLESSPQLISLSPILKTLMEHQSEFLSYIKSFYTKKYKGLKFRDHGDFKLNQILFTGRDYIFVDFEGGATRTISSRRLKHPPYRDLASFMVSVWSLTHEVLDSKIIKSDENILLAPWIRAWAELYCEQFFKSYMDFKNEESIKLTNEANESSAFLNIFLLMSTFQYIQVILKRKKYSQLSGAIETLIDIWSKIKNLSEQ